MDQDVRMDKLPYDYETLKDTIKIRRSVYDLQGVTLDVPYPGEMPEELEKFRYCFAREGHVIMIIPQNYLEEAIRENDLDAYEIAIPVKFVLEKGYKFVDGDDDHLVGFFDYDPETQMVNVPFDYYEY